MRVLIVASGIMAAEIIRRELRHSSCEVIGFVGGREICAATVSRQRPDVIVVDDGRGEGTLTDIRTVRAAAPAAKLVLLTANMDAAWLAKASQAGIDAALAKTVSHASLGLLLREVASGNVFHAFASSARDSAPEFVSTLTPREREILSLVAEGAANSHIARSLWVTEQTVKFHLSNIYRKLGVANRTQASHYAFLHGLIEPSSSTLARGGDGTPLPAAA
ncbi:MAG TPA: response regulator transcription factor [Solirubrobacteraceae bacterium]|nr:response regulator transcription factor [Solirubrobacteraceae bacterium]